MIKCYTLLLLSILLKIYDISIFYILTHTIPYLSQTMSLHFDVREEMLAAGQTSPLK